MASTPLKSHIPGKPLVGDINTMEGKGFLRRVRDFCFGEASASPTVMTAAFTAAEYYFYAVDCTAAPFTITLPPTQYAGQGRKYLFFAVVGGGAAVSFAATAGSGDTLYAASGAIQSLDDVALWYSDGAGGWYKTGDATGGGGGGGAPTNVSYLVLGLDATLTAERQFIAGNRLGAVDAGANNGYTVNVVSPVVSKTANYAVGASDYVIFCDCTTGNLTITLRAANVIGAGFSPSIRVKRTDSSGHTVTVAAAGADTIDGAASITLGPLQAVELESDGVSLWGVM